MSTSAKWASLLGRICLALVFLFSGIGKIANFQQTAAMMASKGMPATTLLLAGAIAFELLGSLSVILGYKARWGALLLIVFLIPATLVFHDFWAFQGRDREMQLIHFLKNVAIAGGLLTLLANGPGELALEARLARRAAVA